MNASKSIPDCTDPWLVSSSKCSYPNRSPSSVEWPSYTNQSRCCPPRKPGPLYALPRKLSLTQAMYRPFINASGCLNPDLGQLGDDDEAYRRWQARTNRYRREDKSSRLNKISHKHNRRRRRRDNSRAKVRPAHKMTASTHTRRMAISSLGLATTVESPPSPPLLLLPPPLASVTVPLTTPAETRTHAS